MLWDTLRVWGGLSVSMQGCGCFFFLTYCLLLSLWVWGEAS